MKRCRLGTKALLIIQALCIGLSSCWAETKYSSTKEKDYPEALFTLGEMATIKIEIPETTWQNILAKASDKTYYKILLSAKS